MCARFGPRKALKAAKHHQVAVTRSGHLRSAATGNAILALVPSKLKYKEATYSTDMFFAWLSHPNVLMMSLPTNNHWAKLDTATLKDKNFAVDIDYSVYIVNFDPRSQSCVEKILSTSQRDHTTMADAIADHRGPEQQLQLTEDLKLPMATLLKGEAVLIHTTEGEAELKS